MITFRIKESLMVDPTTPTLACLKEPTFREGDESSLTVAQRDFAKLLGLLLAQRWSEEQRIERQADSYKTQP
jgi:hypothetical protein